MKKKKPARFPRITTHFDDSVDNEKVIGKI